MPAWASGWAGAAGPAPGRWRSAAGDAPSRHRRPSPAAAKGEPAGPGFPFGTARELPQLHPERGRWLGAPAVRGEPAPCRAGSAPRAPAGKALLGSGLTRGQRHWRVQRRPAGGSGSAGRGWWHRGPRTLPRGCCGTGLEQQQPVVPAPAVSRRLRRQCSFKGCLVPPLCLSISPCGSGRVLPSGCDRFHGMRTSPGAAVRAELTGRLCSGLLRALG